MAEEYTVKIMMRLIAGEVGGRRPAKDEFAALSTEEEQKQLYFLSKKHDLAHIVGRALKEADVPLCEKAKSKFGREELTAVYRYGRNEAALEKICALFEKEELDYLPLKGAVIRRFYPLPELRTSCDIDILVRGEELERAAQILTAAGYERGDKGAHDISFFTPEKVHLELHFTITERHERMDKVLARVWDYAHKDPARRHRYEMDPAYLVFHLAAHTCHHLLIGGCGVRPMLDLYILDRAMPYDRAAAEKLLSEAQLLTFYRQMKALSEVWFGDSGHTELTRELENYILGAGVYGNLENASVSRQARSGSKLKTIFRRIFAPYSTLKVEFPVLERHPILTPFCQCGRWFRIVRNKRVSRGVRELQINAGVKEEQTGRVKKLFGELDLL